MTKSIEDRRKANRDNQRDLRAFVKANPDHLKSIRFLESKRATTRRQYWKKHQEMLDRNKEYRELCKIVPELKERGRQISKRSREKHKNDPHFKAKKNMRMRISTILRGYSRARRIIKAPVELGCSTENFLIYFESLFQPGMNWDNYGIVWESDHIVPCDLFDLTNPAHARVCHHFSNLQPLGRVDNRKKKPSHFDGLPQHIKQKLESEIRSEQADSAQNLSLQ